MALNKNACLLLAMIVMVSSNAVVNGQTLKNDISPSPSPNAAMNEWKANMINLLGKPIEIQLLSIKTFIDVELPRYVEKLDPDTKNAILDGCINSTKDTLTLLDGVTRMLQENETMAKLDQTLTDAEVAGRGCLNELSHYNVNDVPTISELVKEYETALRQAKSSILWEN